MVKNRILQHSGVAFCTTAVLLFFSWMVHRPNLHDVLFGKGFWYYTLLQYVHINPFTANLFTIGLIVLGAAVATAAISQLTNHSWLSPFFGVFYACNPWMLHMTEERSLYIFAIFAVPIVFTLSFSVTKHRFALPLLAGVVGAMGVAYPSTLIGSALIIFSAHLFSKHWWKPVDYCVLACAAIAGIIFNYAFVTQSQPADAFLDTINGSFDLATLNTFFPYNSILRHLFSLGTLGNSIHPNALSGFIILCVVLCVAAFRKLRYEHIAFFITGIIAGIFALGPVLVFHDAIKPRIILPYAVIAQLFPEVQHRPAVLISILIFAFFVFVALTLQTLSTTHKPLAWIFTAVFIVTCGVQILPLPFPFSSRVHYVGYSHIQSAMTSDGRILEFHEQEEKLFAPYSEQRYQDSHIVPVSASSNEGEALLEWLQQPMPFIPQNTPEVYNALMRDYYHINVIDRISCVPGLLSTQPRFTAIEDISSLPLTLTTEYADKCHTLSTIVPAKNPITGLLTTRTSNDGVARLYPSRNDPQSIKFIDDAKLSYLNTTADEQLVTIAITGATASPLHIGIAVNDTLVTNQSFDQSTSPFTFSFSFPVPENGSALLDFVLKDDLDDRITDNKSDQGLQIQNISYTIQKVAHY